MSKPLKEDYIIRIKSRIEQRLDEPAAEEEKEEFVELMTRGSLVLKGGSYYVTYRETETTGYEGCTTTLKIAADGSRVAMLRFGKGGGAGTQSTTSTIPRTATVCSGRLWTRTPWAGPLPCSRRSTLYWPTRPKAAS